MSTLNLPTEMSYDRNIAMSDPLSTPNRTHLLSILVPLLNSNIVEIAISLWKVARQLLSAKVHEGMYEELESEIELELLDTKGHLSMYRKRQKVRFLQDNIIAFQDQAWGDGDIFADYKCTPGFPVDRYQEGYLYRVLISLRSTRNRGDIEQFHIDRTIKDGFTSAIETLQTDINHRTQVLKLSLIFPGKRMPTSVKVIEHHARKTIILGPEHQRLLPDGRWQATWMIQKPYLFESYILRWEW
jgi:hypothetical protein